MGAVWLLLLILLVVLGVIVLPIALIVRSSSGRRPPASASLAPGWYPDHANPALLRWFDGYQWTNQTHPRH
ncbi:DUF2510 domain-containing protein [Nocardia sp. NPDC005998]|uniref:DUF2510 domain-containing protein n=1 Tax=Nocardia sp. NPDC005998 TaxID=3156894 RepID=UPI0033AB54AA